MIEKTQRKGVAHLAYEGLLDYLPSCKTRELSGSTVQRKSTVEVPERPVSPLLGTIT